MPSQETLIRPYDVAGRLGLSTETVVRWARQGKLPGAVFLPNGHVMFDQHKIEEFISSGGHAPNSPLATRSRKTFLQLAVIGEDSFTTRGSGPRTEHRWTGEGGAVLPIHPYGPGPQ
jgi:predicted DNA-binding transcriptional regulator AlpA